jgi:hypothetical protein
VEDELKPPIFLIGNVRSGTTLVHDLFDLHPSVASWFEPRTLWMYADPGREHDRFDASDATTRVTRYVRGRFLKFQRRHAGRRIMEKTPSNVMRIPFVHAIFPEARFVYLVREPLANLSSSEIEWRRGPIHLRHLWYRLREVPKTQMHYYAGRFVRDHFRMRVLGRHVSVWGVRYPGIYEDLERISLEEVICKQWVACSRQAEADFARIDPGLVVRIRYEDFVASPVTHFGRICEHFGLELASELERELRGRVDPGRQLKWRRLAPEVIDRCLPILAPEMARHGYEMPGNSGERLATGGGSDSCEARVPS